jgi:CheY-like chemotaxis protein
MFGRRKKVPRILIVEDREVNNSLYREVFTAAGFEVLTLTVVDDNFIDIVCEFSPDIISMDLMIEYGKAEHSFAGFDLLSLLRNEVRTSAIPVVILTAFFEESKVEEAKALGAVDFVSVSGHTIQKLPEIFLRYLDDPKHYVPTHPLFRQ